MPENGEDDIGATNENNRAKEEQQRSNRKPYVWIHPPKDLELSVHDELFVLCD